MSKPTIVALAEQLAEWFPELQGRAIAVSEVEPFSDKTNNPTLPIAVVALVSENAVQAGNGASSITLTPDILAQFIFKPTKYTREDGQETPFYAFYDYEALRDRLLQGLRGWRTPRNGAVVYRSLDVESDEFAVYLAFRLQVSEKWCPPAPDIAPCDMPHEAPVVSISARMYSAPGCCKDVEPCPTPVDPCQAAREGNPYGKEANP